MNKNIKKFLNIISHSPNIFLFLTFVIIFLIGYGSALHNNFLFHDDWITFYWNRIGLFESITTHHYFWSHNQTARNVGTIFMSLNQYYLNDISSGNFFRFLSVIILTLTAFIFSKWMINNGYNKLFSIFFVGTSLLLPVFHTPIYMNTLQFVIITILLCTILLHMYDRYFQNKSLFERKYAVIFYSFILIIFLFLCVIAKTLALILLAEFILISAVHYIFTKYKNKDFSLLKSINFSTIITTHIILLNSYLASGMIIFTAVVIKILSPTNHHNKLEQAKVLKMFFMGIISIIIFYLGFKFQFHLDKFGHSVTGRNFIIETNYENIVEKIHIYFRELLPMAVTLWFPEKVNIIKGYPIYLLITSFIFILFSKIKIRYALLILVSIPATLAPILLPAENIHFPYHAQIAHGVLIYFLLIWSANKFINFSLIQTYISQKRLIIEIKKQKYIITVVFLALTMILCNSTAKNHIVIPQMHELNYLRSKLNNDLVRNKISNSENLNIILKNYFDISYNKKIISNYTIGAATWQYYDWTPNILTGILRELGFNESVHRGNTKFLVFEKPKKIHIELPWGNLIYGTNITQDTYKNKLGDIIYIDMNDLKKIY